MANEQEKAPPTEGQKPVAEETADLVKGEGAAEGSKTESAPEGAKSEPSALAAQAGESAAPVAEGGELDLSPVIKKKDEEDVPFEVLSVENQPGSRIDAKVEVPEAEFEKRLETILKDLRKTVVVNGFRRGHAPLRMLRNIYGKEAQREAVDKMKESIVPALAKQKEWRVVGDSDLKDFQVETGKPVVATYTFEIFPKVEVADDLLESISVDVVSQDVTDAMVGEELEKLQQANATYEAKAADQGFDPEKDGVAVDLFVTDSHGHNVAELSRMDEFLGNPKRELPEPVVTALAGKKAGDHVEAKVTQELAEGEDRKPDVLTYHVDVQSIKTLRLPVLDDEFAKDVSDKFQTLDDLRKDIRRDLEEQKEEKRRSDAVGAIIKEVLEKVPFEVPRSLVLATAAGQIERQEKELRQYGISLSQLLGDRVKGFVEETTEGAEGTVKASLVLRTLADRQGFEVGDEEMQKEFERLGEQAGRSPMAIRAQYEARKKLDSLKSQLVQRKVEDFLLERAKVTYKAPEAAKPAKKKAEVAEASETAEPAKEKKSKAKSAPKAKAAEEAKPAKAAETAKTGKSSGAAKAKKPKAEKPAEGEKPAPAKKPKSTAKSASKPASKSASKPASKSTSKPASKAKSKAEE